MKSVNPLKFQNKKSALAASAQELRFVLSESGTFLFASPAFTEIMEMDTPLIGVEAAEILHFVAPDDALGDRSFFKMHGINAPETAPLTSGNHTLICGAKGTRIDFQFDWVQGPDTKSYLVASAAVTGDLTPREADLRRLVTQVVQNNNATADNSDGSAFAASAALRAEELRQFLDMSDDLMCTIRADGDIIRFNQAFGHVLGYSSEDMIGKVFVDFVDAADRTAVRAALYSLCQAETMRGAPSADAVTPAIHIDCRMTRADGGIRWTNWTLRMGGPVLYCLGRDTTQSRKREAALTRREQQLSEAQALAHMGHWRWEVGDAEIEFSSELYNIFGVTRHEFIPTMDSINALIHRRDLGRLYQAFQRAIIQQNDYDMDFRAIRSDGQVRTIRCEGRCEMDAEGDVVALFGIMQDITPQKEHERALREAKESAEAAYASKSRFLANMSHELRTPLNAIIGFSDLIDKQLLGPLGNERYLDYIGAIRESGHHLLDLITDILDMSKIEAGKYELSLESVNLNQILRTVVQMMEARAQEGKLTLSCKLPDEDVIVVADRRALKQIFLNLMSNAVKFTEHGGRVDVALEDAGDHVTVEIRDTGIGIPAHKLADVTKPFEQVSNAFTRRHEGSGLGLAITKDLTSLHSGTMTIDSRLGMGTAVTITLPKKR